MTSFQKDVIPAGISTQPPDTNKKPSVKEGFSLGEFLRASLSFCRNIVYGKLWGKHQHKTTCKMTIYLNNIMLL